MNYFEKAQDLLNKRNLKEAKKFFELAIKENPIHFDSLHSLGVICCMNGLYEKALIYFNNAIDLKPNDLKVLYDKAVALQELKYFDSAIKIYNKIIHTKPNYAWAYYKKANALQLLEKFEESIISYDKVIYLKPNFAEAYYNRGVSLYNLRQYKQSLNSYSIAIKIKSNFAEAYYNRAIVLVDLKEYKKAIEDLDQAIKIKTRYDLALALKAEVLEILNEYEEAISNYKMCIKINPDGQLLFGSLLYAKLKICDWNSYNFYVDQCEKKICLKILSSPLFCLLSFSDRPSFQFKASKYFVHKKYSDLNASITKAFNLAENDKITIGYFSADFQEHATSYLASELFENHNKNKFKIIAFSFTPPINSAMRSRLIKSFDEFIDVFDKSDVEIAKIAREKNIDIAVDLKGHTALNRFGIFAYKAAPIQVNFLGYPGTSGANYIDYIIADKIVIPEINKKFFTEKVVYLPNSYQCNTSDLPELDVKLSKKNYNLPEMKFVFGCFNNNYKILPNIYDAWMRILKKVNNSVLWLYKDNDLVVSNLRLETKKRGVDPARIIFADKCDYQQHLQRNQLIDLFLDTYPCNAHTTASDALKSAVPILTLVGSSFASRVAASLLTSIGATELITYSLEEYESKAIELATNSDKLQEIKNKLIRSRTTSSLFKPSVFAKNIEAAFQEMHQRHIDGLEPDHFEVQ